MLTPRWLVGPLALLTMIGVACVPKDRPLENVGGQGGSTGVGGDMSSASSLSSGSGTSTSTGMCAPVPGAEDCFNGLDDDCNGTTDCEDPACNATAECEPAAPNAVSGVVVAETDPCPPGFAAEEQIIHRGLADDGCVGCACKTATPICTGEVWYYDTAAACSGDLAQTKGTYAGIFGSTCAPSPINNGGQMYGARTSTWSLKQTCSPFGAASPAPVVWKETQKFCRAKAEGQGCGAGKSCVPKQATAPHCALAAGATSCNGFATAQTDWYTAVTDTRACGACGCTVSGGSCSPLVLALGSDYTCGVFATVKESSKTCFNIYAPPANLVNKPVTGTCVNDASPTGTLQGTGQSTLCCQP